MKKLLSYIALVLVAALLLTGTAYAQQENATLETMLESIVTVEDTRSIDKTETVYVIAGADGTANQVIASEWLKNPNRADTIADYSELENLENTNGYETYTAQNRSLTWAANGSDIHYQGTTDCTLPVTEEITYALDGVSMQPEEMAGKSGHVTIRFAYQNHTQSAVTVDGEETEICVPFLVASGLMLSNDTFSNVMVSNGTVYNDGSRNIVIGYALPGLRESLALDQDTCDIPDAVVIEADTTDFSLSATMSVAVNGLLGTLSFDSNGLADWNDQLADFEDAASRLADGTQALSTAAASLSDGLNTISANSVALNEGANTVFQSLTAAAQNQLNAALTAAGMEPVASMTPSNYNDVLSVLLSNISTMAREQASTVAEPQVRAAVTQQVTQQVSKQVADAVNAQVKEQVEQQVTAGVVAKGYTQEQAAAYLQSEEGAALLASNLEQQLASQDVQQLIETTAQQQMASDEVQATIDAYTAQQMKSSEVQAQLDDAVSAGLAQSEAYQSILALQEQLDSFAAFYNGLSAYTEGVDTASAGAQELASGADSLAVNMQAFYTEGVETLVNALSINCSDTLERLQAVAEADRAYQSFGGIAENSSGSVKFIWRTDGIE